ncbi:MULTISPECIES: Fe2+-dependent dioxygenase [unclassified Bordetella]|uniref:Fe2+-dependent dioxygenase n=1 Tax=unclassified Bordetella TaxID=2630031 RepID=UPI0013297274|nr:MULTISPECIES: Fe2+-dependent dioxygenase [unclassified Bordetella]MVW70425.1 Fe2+-dependent dioxygenase [Bordetella sp. 15P40C-2]MVW78635.1 Fe2+-dependent dioxygenase [Bordetella sp. 02P26C-1]
MLHIPQVLTPDEVREMRARLHDAQWVDGRATVGTQGAVVKRNRQLAESSALARELGEIVLRALARNPLYFAAALPLRVVPPLFNRYESEETYGFHVDGAVRSHPAAPGWLRTDLSATLFLCEPDEYDGGELIVKDLYGEHLVKLPAGDMILYPANSLHCVTAVTRGARVASFFWIQSMIREHGRRQMLFELDQTIQQLRMQLGETEQTLSLTNCYHNLLREWSEL